MNDDTLPWKTWSAEGLSPAAAAARAAAARADFFARVRGLRATYGLSLVEAKRADAGATGIDVEQSAAALDREIDALGDCDLVCAIDPDEPPP